MPDMTAIEALEKYSFRLVDGAYLRVLGDQPDLTTERWVPVEGGFKCYKQPGPGAWGKLMKSGPFDGLVAVPIGLNEAFQNVGGVHPETHPQCFEFVWPEERVREIYTYAEEGWRKVTDEETGETKMVREE